MEADATEIFRILDSSTERLRITSAGLVGIGITHPAERLAVVAEEDSNATDNGLSIYRSVADDKVTINAQGGAAKFIADGGSSYIPFRFYRYNGTNLDESLTIGADGDTSLSYNLLIPEDKKIHLEGSSADDYNAIWKADSENTVIVTSRYHIANIIDSNNDDANAYWSVRKDGTTLAGSDELMRVESDGSVGIGTNDPGTSLLRVHGGTTLLTHASANDATTKAEMISNATLRVKPHTSYSGNLNFAQVNNGSSIGLQYTNGSGTANWDIALQPFGGQVGIGTIGAGSNKLQVNGGSAFYGDGGAPVIWGDTSYLGALTFEGAAQPVVRANSGKALIFQVNQSTEALRLKSDGKSYFSSNLGLGGQTSPASSIHINDFSNDGYELKLTGNALQFNRTSNSYIDQVNDSGRIIFRVTSSNTEAMRINEGKVKFLINHTSNSNATMVVKTLTDNTHPTIKVSTSSNGYTFLGDEYATDESQFTMGCAYSGASLVMGWGVKVSTSANDTYLSSQDTFATKHSAIKHDGSGWRFYLTPQVKQLPLIQQLH